MKQLMNNYWAPTPKKWRKLGDALLGVSSTIPGFANASDNHFIAYTALICGVLGKLITNLFTEETQTETL